MDHKVAKMDCHSDARRNGPTLRDLQKEAAVDVRRPLPCVTRHAICANWHSKKRWEQSSAAPAHIGHSVGASGQNLCRRDLVISL